MRLRALFEIHITGSHESDFDGVDGTTMAEYKPIGKLGQYDVGVKIVPPKGEYDHPGGYYVFAVFDGDQPIAQIWAIRFMEGIQVKAVGVKEPYRGQNIAVNLYAMILPHCRYIYSDETQTREGAAIWKRLMMDKRFIVDIVDYSDWLPVKQVRRKDTFASMYGGGKFDTNDHFFQVSLRK